MASQLVVEGVDAIEDAEDRTEANIVEPLDEMKTAEEPDADQASIVLESKFTESSKVGSLIGSFFVIGLSACVLWKS